MKVVLLSVKAKMRRYCAFGTILSLRPEGALYTSQMHTKHHVTTPKTPRGTQEAFELSYLASRSDFYAIFSQKPQIAYIAQNSYIVLDKLLLLPNRFSHRILCVCLE